MVDVVYLQPGQEPAPGERYLLIEWATSSCAEYLRLGGGLRYRVGPEKHFFWLTEAPRLAGRLGLKKMYFVGRPRPVSAAPARGRISDR